MAAIKICGLMNEADARLLNEYDVDYAGFVLFYEKSKRCLSIHRAKQIMLELNRKIKRVAVTVSPDVIQVKEIVNAGFDIIQIHGKLNADVLYYLEQDEEAFDIRILRAYNLNGNQCESEQEQHFKIMGYLTDGRISGSGETFDWELLKNFQRHGKMLALAGGLNEDNVIEGIQRVMPDIVDVSTGVEDSSGKRKDPEKVKAFVRRVRSVL